MHGEVNATMKSWMRTKALGQYKYDSMAHHKYECQPGIIEDERRRTVTGVMVI